MVAGSMSSDIAGCGAIGETAIDTANVLVIESLVMVTGTCVSAGACVSLSPGRQWLPVSVKSLIYDGSAAGAAATRAMVMGCDGMAATGAMAVGCIGAAAAAAVVIVR